MKRFRNGQRVQIIDAEHPMKGDVGTVVRVRLSDDGAFVAMDVAPPPEVRLFPPDDEPGRGNHVMLYPDECVDAIAKAEA